jgi:uncharacterized RDD family membrane protein YckC
VENRSAGLLPRLGAFALDLIPILVYIILLLIVFAGIPLGIFHLHPLQGADPVLFDAFVFVTVVLPVILYFAIQESSLRQATWGKRRLGLQVITKNGGKLSFVQALMRSVVKFLPWQIAHTCLFHIPGWPFAVQGFPEWVTAGFVILYALLFAYLITLTLTPKHRALYDWLAGSYVVRMKG